MTPIKPVVNFRLRSITRDALLKFRTHMPAGVFAQMDSQVPGKEPGTTKGDEFVEEWAGALVGISFDAIEDAVSRWLRDPEKLDKDDRTRIPTIAAFRSYAKAVDYDHYRIRPQPTLVAHLPENHASASKRTELQLRAEAALGSRELAQEVWGVLMKAAPPGERSKAVRDGDVSEDDFDIAIAIVRESDRLAKKKLADEQALLRASA